MFLRMTLPISTLLLAAGLLSCGGGAGGGIDVNGSTNTVPTVVTEGVTSITQTTAAAIGNVTSDGGSEVTVSGICWDLSANPTLSNNMASGGSGTGYFSGALTSLQANRTYHIRAFATNGVGTAYGSDLSFSTANTGILRALNPSIIPSASSNAVQVYPSPDGSPYNYYSGTTIHMTIKPAVGYQFKGWSGTDYTAVYGNDIDMTVDRTLTAEFESVTQNHLVISQIQTRGSNGAKDEFIELYNPTGSPITLDSTWKLESRGTGEAAYTPRWAGASLTIVSHGYVLIAGSGYNGATTADATVNLAIADAGGVRLMHGAAVVDAVCYGASSDTSKLQDGTFTTEWDPAIYTNTADADISIQRKPGGASGNGSDSGDNSADFLNQAAASPRNRASTPMP